MSEVLKGYLFALAYGLLCLLLAYVCYKLGTPKIFTRKLVHILVGFEWVILYIFHGASVHFLAVCLIFLALLVFVAWKKLIPMISSDSDNALGTVYYAVSMSIMALACIFCKKLIVPFGIAVFCTSLGDGFAGVIGQSIKRYNPRVYANKSLLGTLSNFAFSLLTALFFVSKFNINLDFWHALFIAILAVELELFTGKGFDNITLPLGVFSLASFLAFAPNAMNYIVPILVTPLIVAVVCKKHLLSSTGIFAALALDVIISISLGNFGFILLLLFLVLGSLTDIVKKWSREYNKIEKKGSCRDHIQVLANAIVASFSAVLFKSTGCYVFIIAFAASLAEALADTASSALGAFSRKTYDLFKMRPCQKGLSGGMSLYGTFAALIFSAFIGLVCMLFGYADLSAFLIISISGFIGTLFDSFLGSIFQIKYKCSICGAIVEKEIHCDCSCSKHSGVRFFTNDTVNLFSTMFSAVLASIIFILI